MESFEDPRNLTPSAADGRPDRTPLIAIFDDIRTAIIDMLASFAEYLAAADVQLASHWFILAATSRRIEPVLCALLVPQRVGGSIRYPRAMFDADAVATEITKPTGKVRLMVIAMAQRSAFLPPIPPPPPGATSGSEFGDSLDNDYVPSIDLERRQRDAFFWLRSAQYILADVLVVALLELTLKGTLAKSFASVRPGWVVVETTEQTGTFQHLFNRIIGKQRMVILPAASATAAASPVQDAALMAGGAHFWDDAERVLFDEALSPEQQHLIALWAHTFASWIDDVRTGGQWMDWFDAIASPLVPTLRNIFPHLLLHDMRLDVGDASGEFQSPVPGGRPLDPHRLAQWTYITMPGDLDHVWRSGGRAESDDETRLITNDRIQEALYRRVEAVVDMHNHEAV